MTNYFINVAENFDPNNPSKIRNCLEIVYDDGENYIEIIKALPFPIDHSLYNSEWSFLMKSIKRPLKSTSIYLWKIDVDADIKVSTNTNLNAYESRFNSINSSFGEIFENAYINFENKKKELLSKDGPIIECYFLCPRDFNRLDKDLIIYAYSVNNLKEIYFDSQLQELYSLNENIEHDIYNIFSFTQNNKSVDFLTVTCQEVEEYTILKDALSNEPNINDRILFLIACFFIPNFEQEYIKSKGNEKFFRAQNLTKEKIVEYLKFLSKFKPILFDNILRNLCCFIESTATILISNNEFEIKKFKNKNMNKIIYENEKLSKFYLNDFSKDNFYYNLIRIFINPIIFRDVCNVVKKINCDCNQEKNLNDLKNLILY